MTKFTDTTTVQSAIVERTAMVNESAVEFKQSVANASHNIKMAGRMAVVVFEAALERYWTTDRRSCNNLEALINGFKRHPRICSAMRKLLPVHAPITVIKRGGGFVIENKADVSKKAKAKLKAECPKLVAMELTSVLNHPLIKVSVEMEWTMERDASKMKSAVKSMLDNGVDMAVITGMLQEAVQQHVKQVETVVSTGKVVSIAKAS